MTTTVRTDTEQAAEAPPRQRSHRGRNLLHFNWLGGIAGWIWLGIALLPIYWIVITSFKTQADYFGANPLKPPTHLSLENYRLVIQEHFVRYFLNSTLVTWARCCRPCSSRSWPRTRSCAAAGPGSSGRSTRCS